MAVDDVGGSPTVLKAGVVTANEPAAALHRFLVVTTACPTGARPI